jgi:hypothetical protein
VDKLGKMAYQDWLLHLNQRNWILWNDLPRSEAKHFHEKNGVSRLMGRIFNGYVLVFKHGQLNIVYHIGKQLCSQPSVSAKWACNGNSFPTSSVFKMGLLSNKPLLLILITVSLQLVIIYLHFLMLFSKPNRLLFWINNDSSCIKYRFLCSGDEKMDDSAK